MKEFKKRCINELLTSLVASHLLNYFCRFAESEISKDAAKLLHQHGEIIPDRITMKKILNKEYIVCDIDIDLNYSDMTQNEKDAHEEIDKYDYDIRILIDEPDQSPSRLEMLIEISKIINTSTKDDGRSIKRISKQYVLLP